MYGGLRTSTNSRTAASPFLGAAGTSHARGPTRRGATCIGRADLNAGRARVDHAEPDVMLQAGAACTDVELPRAFARRIGKTGRTDGDRAERCVALALSNARTGDATTVFRARARVRGCIACSGIKIGRAHV